MLTFDTQTQREQYAISAEEVLPPYGPMLTYERSTRTYWRPKSAGRGASHWERLTGTMKPRAAANTYPERGNERHVGDMTILTGDDHVVAGDFILDAQVTVNGELSMRVPEAAYVPPGSVDKYGEQTDDGGRVVDGEETHMHSRSEMMRCLLRQSIGHGHTVTVPHGYQEIFAKGLILNGQIILNGETA